MSECVSERGVRGPRLTSDFLATEHTRDPDQPSTQETQSSWLRGVQVGVAGNHVAFTQLDLAIVAVDVLCSRSRDRATRVQHARNVAGELELVEGAGVRNQGPIDRSNKGSRENDPFRNAAAALTNNREARSGGREYTAAEDGATD
jgi:hypothetical protein